MIPVSTAALGLAAIALFVAPGLIAQTTSPLSISATVETDFASRYIYRGFAWSQGPVMQPYASVTRGSLTFGLWANVVLGNEPQRGTLNESDFTLFWSHNQGKWRVEPVVEYWSDRPVHGGSDSGDGEISVKFSRIVKGPIRIFTNQAYDIFRYRDSYYGEAGPSLEGKWKNFDTDLNGHLAWASAGFNRVYAGIAVAGLNLISLDGSATRTLGSHGLYTRVHFEASRLLNSEVRRASGNGSLFTAGVAIGFRWPGLAKSAASDRGK